MHSIQRAGFVIALATVTGCGTSYHYGDGGGGAPDGGGGDLPPVGGGTFGIAVGDAIRANSLQDAMPQGGRQFVDVTVTIVNRSEATPVTAAAGTAAGLVLGCSWADWARFSNSSSTSSSSCSVGE